MGELVAAKHGHYRAVKLGVRRWYCNCGRVHTRDGGSFLDRIADFRQAINEGDPIPYLTRSEAEQLAAAERQPTPSANALNVAEVDEGRAISVVFDGPGPLGVRLERRPDGAAVVTGFASTSPALAAGVPVGSLVVGIDGSAIAGYDDRRLQDVLPGLLLGPGGRAVVLKFRRPLDGIGASDVESSVGLQRTARRCSVQ